MIVYQLKSPSGNSYIGQTKRSLELRFTEHLSFYRKWLESGRERKGGSTKLFYAFDKYGIDCWEISILHEANTLEELNEKEIYFINLFDTVSKGYNITLGGLGRNVENLEESHKEGISSSMLSFYGTENGLKNREEKSKFFKRNNPSKKGSIPWNTGKNYHLSDEVKERRKNNPNYKNRILSEEHKNKISKTKQERGPTESQIIARRQAAKNRIGSKQTEYQKETVAKKLSKDWKITDPEGNVFTITNLNKFCRDVFSKKGLKIDQGNLSAGSSSKGYKATRIT